MPISQHVIDFLDELAASLRIPDSRYEAAERSYNAVAEWLVRPNSTLAGLDARVYCQGSFRLGTAIRPNSEEEDYDVDAVCEIELPPTRVTQRQLKEALGSEISAYASAKSMAQPENGRRCWTLHYADGAQFHLDILPARPDGVRQRLILENRGFDSSWAETAIAITDTDDPYYDQLSEHWPHSNPIGYANWFRSRMQTVFDAQRDRIALLEKKNVEDIPAYRVQTPLQSAIQILKHHRDVMFKDNPDAKPISIIITTLAAHAYNQELTVADSIYEILGRLSNNIEVRGGTHWIPNPTDAAENFADRWETHPERRDAFYSWLDQAQSDFLALMQSDNRAAGLEAMRPRLSSQALDRVSRSRLRSTAPRIAGRIRQLVNPRHRQEPPWKRLEAGEVSIAHGTVNRRGFRPQRFQSNSPPLPKRQSLVFEATTNVPQPFDIYWQVVNTGEEAERAGGLRGGFDRGTISAGRLTRKESTLYEGKHSIECFVVKNGYLAARSGQFIVNIE